MRMGLGMLMLSGTIAVGAICAEIARADEAVATRYFSVVGLPS